MKDNASPLAEEATAYYHGLLRPVFADRKFLIAGPVAAGLGGLAWRLTELGAERPFLIAASEGTGTLPAREVAELRVLGIQSADVLEQSRNLHRAVEDLPVDLRREIDAWDPAGTARFIFASPLAKSLDVAGRRAYAARPPAWAALEDKVRIDAFWDAVGVRRAPSRIVTADYEALRSAGELDRGLGTVWAADAREGTHGGGLGLRWVRHGDDGRESFLSLRRMADRIRVMPFLEGISASIHGIVFPDSVAVFRPVEMVVLRPIAGDRLRYAGCATAFDPLPDDRKAMRDLAYRVGIALREAVNYRGPFGIDGILADEGYLPTELNARAGAALGPLARSAGLPLTPLCLAVIEGERLDYRPDLLEQAIVGPSYLRGLVGYRQEVRREPDAGCRAGRRRVPGEPTGRRVPRHCAGRPKFGRRIPAVHASSRTGRTRTLRRSRGGAGIPLHGPRARNGLRRVRSCPKLAPMDVPQHRMTGSHEGGARLVSRSSGRGRRKARPQLRPSGFGCIDPDGCGDQAFACDLRRFPEPSWPACW